jgi:AraC-like DNA-binding protein
MRDPIALPPPRLGAGDWLEAGRGLSVQDNLVTNPVGLHWHEFFELSFVRAGTGRHVCNGTATLLAPGDVLPLTPADFHELRPDPGGALHIVNVVYRDDVVPERLRDELPAQRMPELAAEFDRLADEARHTDDLAAEAARATLVRILVDLARRGPRAPRPLGDGAVRADIGRALRYIDHHFREAIRLSDAAAAACLSPHHFSGLLRAASGVSFQEYVMQRRLRFARGLLAASDLPVTEVCHAAGFNDLTHFGRSYRRLFGHAPSTDPARHRPGAARGADGVALPLGHGGEQVPHGPGDQVPVRAG